MMIRFIAVMAVLSVFGNMSFAEELRLGGYDKPPYMMEDAGICVDIVRKAARKAGYGTSYKLLPHKRGLRYFTDNRIDAETCVSPKWRSQYKEISAYSEPFFSTENVVIVRKESDIGATKDIRDFRGKTFGTILGYFITDGFQEEFEAGRMVREDANTQDKNIRKLVAKRFDGIIIDRITGSYLIKQLGFDPGDFRIAYVFETKSLLSARIHKSREYLIPKLDRALAEMKNDGTIDRIISRYMSTGAKDE